MIYLTISHFLLSVPFAQITDCEIQEPAGNTCIVVRNVLTTVSIDTASSGTEGKKELRLAGLKDAHAFKRLVWAMKRAQGNPMNAYGANQGASALTSSAVEATSGDGSVSALLREIRDELRQNNDLLKNLKASDSATAPHVLPPPEEAEFI